MPYPGKLRTSLKKYGVDERLIDNIYKGYEDIKDSSSKKTKIPFMRRAMKIMDENLDADLCYQIIDSCACCIGGTRDKKVKEFLKSIEGKNLTLEERVKALREAHPFENYMTTLQEDGTIRDGIYYKVDEEFKCACPCLNKEKLDEPISSTYCLCCAGHFRHYLQKSLGVNIKTKQVESSPLESMGKKPCVFIFEVV
jgi:hypothetical protein